MNSHSLTPEVNWAQNFIQISKTATDQYLLKCPLHFWAQETPTHPAIITDDLTLSYQELDQLVSSYPLPPCKHKRVAFPATINLATLLLFYALIREEAIACPFNPKVPLHTLAANYTLTPRLPQVKTAHPPPLLPLSNLATMLTTSGSTGTPKVACHTLANHFFSALGLLEPLSLNQSSIYHLTLPLFHVSGIAPLFRTLLSGATLRLSKHPLPPVTHTSLVPTQLYRLLQDPSTHKPPPSLQCALIGGDACPLSLHHPDWPLFFSYGMTEMSSTITLNKKLLPYRELKIQHGEIFVAGKTLFAGYHNAPPQTDWFPTGDLGTLTDTTLTVTGRKDRQFISGGENIQPEEIERALLSLPHILSAKVVPQEDAEFGFRPIAIIQDASKTHTPDSIKKLITPLLPKLKHPEVIKFI